MMLCSLYSAWSTKAASSAKSISLMVVWRTLVLAFCQKRFNNLPSDLVWRKTSSVDEPKACLNMTAKKMPNRFGAITRPCFTPLRMLKGSKEVSSNYITPFMSVWND